MGKKGLEAFKFGVYLTLPVLTVMFFNTPEAIKALIERKQYIVFPPEGERPMKGSKEEIAQFLGIQSENVGATRNELKVANSKTTTTFDSAPQKSWWKFW
mmetsp:Transcript_2201/g.2488  ORF Transcript_2201/g.2488 Transcript_2201/m.2488 type:complete len:100 (+) Transcript_2201:95-394(+)